MHNKLSNKRIVVGLLVAPLSSFVATLIYFIILGFIDKSLQEGLSFGLFIALIGTLVFAYPGTCIVGLGLITYYKRDVNKLNLGKFIVTALILTALVANVQLLEDGFGIAYLLSAAASSACFWIIAIYPNRYSPKSSS